MYISVFREPFFGNDHNISLMENKVVQGFAHQQSIYVKNIYCTQNNYVQLKNKNIQELHTGALTWPDPGSREHA